MTAKKRAGIEIKRFNGMQIELKRKKAIANVVSTIDGQVNNIGQGSADDIGFPLRKKNI